MATPISQTHLPVAATATAPFKSMNPVQWALEQRELDAERFKARSAASAASIKASMSRRRNAQPRNLQPLPTGRPQSALPPTDSRRPGFQLDAAATALATSGRIKDTSNPSCSSAPSSPSTSSGEAAGASSENVWGGLEPRARSGGNFVPRMLLPRRHTFDTPGPKRQAPDARDNETHKKRLWMLPA
ncbi:hypothetical protein CspHIS471_0410420 [Cutaneotrichosporon sp. HIS471]|nr:hypothetical protein CspHIS471_0410420 [Cutaneotrichosporon sp. HIS471]